MNRKPKRYQENQFSVHIHTDQFKLIPLKWYIFLITSILRNVGPKQFFDHRLPPRKHILGTKRDKSYTLGGCLSLLAMFSFQSTHTHI